MSDNSVQILSEITTYMKYAKYIPEINRRESWIELCERNMAMHIRKYPQLRAEIQRVYKEFVFTKKVLPSMRSLQFGGRPIELAPNRIFNCAFMPVDHVDAFSETMFLLLGGTGIGYSVQNRHVGKLPVLIGPNSGVRRYVIGDSIEGWADAVKVLVEAYFYGKARPNFDFSDIRKKGAPLVTSGGKAPGPNPLRFCLQKIANLMDHAIETRGVATQLVPLEVHDIMCHIADAVLAGGIRRAAMICLFDRYDHGMLKAKGNFKCSIEDMVRIDDHDNFNCTVRTKWNDKLHQIVLNKYLVDQQQETGKLPWYIFEAQRGRANNSAVLPRAEITQDEFFDLWQKIEDSGSGEPGVYFSNNLDWGTNPCCEIALRPNQFCNLTEVNASDIDSQEELNRRAAAGAFIGTLQAGYTDFHYLRPIWKETTEKDALIGVGLTGIGSGAVLPFDMYEAASHVLAENARVAEIIGINVAARTGTIKPAGTTSLVVGSASGIHAWHNDYYIRRIRVGKNEAIYRYLAEHHPELVADEHFNPTEQAVIEVPQRAPAGSILRHEDVHDLLERVKRFNIEWVRAGHRNGDNTHNVSCTISVKDNEWEGVGRWMWDNRESFNGISVLPYDGGTYIQAPFEDIDEATFNERAKNLHQIDLTNVIEREDATNLAGEVACGAGGCEVTMA